MLFDTKNLRWTLDHTREFGINEKLEHIQQEWYNQQLEPIKVKCNFGSKTATLPR